MKLVRMQLLTAPALVALSGVAHALPFPAPTRADYTTGTSPVYAWCADVNNEADGQPTRTTRLVVVR